MFAALAEFEHALIQERTRAGLAAARARGRKGGRPIKLDEKKQKAVIQLYNERNHSVDEICQMMEISKPTPYSYVRAGEK